MYKKNIEAVIFDMDGVLVDTEPHHTILEQGLFDHFNINISEEEHVTYMGKTSEKMWEEIVRDKNLSEDVMTYLAKHEEEAKNYFTQLADLHPIPGLVDILNYLTETDIPIAVASSSSPAMIEAILKKSGLTKYFNLTVSSVETGKSKPEPDVFLLTASRLNIKPEHCMVIEDSENGIKAAKAAGMLCIAYRNSEESSADEIISEFSELKELLPVYLKQQES